MHEDVICKNNYDTEFKLLWRKACKKIIAWRDLNSLTIRYANYDG